MKLKKIFVPILLVISLFLLYRELNIFRIFTLNTRGNILNNEKRYQDAREKYDSALKIKDSKPVKNNIVTNSYEAQNYQEVIELPSEKYFLRGNSYVKLGESQQDQKEIMKYFQMALDEYKKAMKLSEDMNIKKNYEIIQKRLEDMKNNQQNDQQNKDQNQQDKQDKDNKKDQQDNKQNKEQNQDNKNNDKNKDSEKDKNNQQDKQDKDNNKDQNQNQEQQQDQQNQSEEQQQATTREQIEKSEAASILKKLEGNEKQSFKNNERAMKLNNNSDEPKNRW